jgi:thiol-disulfide isomerase/thioredoxin
MTLLKSKILWVLAVVLLFSGSAFAYTPHAPNIHGNVLNNSLSGYKHINLRKIKNKKLIIVNFWATWCPPCRAEIGDLNAFYKNNKKNVLIIGLNVNTTLTGVKSFLQKFDGGIDYPVIHANIIDIENYGGITFIPQSFFIRNGKIIFHWQGPLNNEMLSEIKNKMGF